MFICLLVCLDYCYCYYFIFVDNFLLWACWELLWSACRHSRKVTMNAHCTVTEHFSCVTDTVMSDPSPIVQVSGLMFLGYSIV